MTVLSGTLPWAVRRGRRREATPWVVIHDPSGDFQGHCFRNQDVDPRLANEWPEGIIFWHIRRGEVRIWRGGRFCQMVPVRRARAGGEG